MNHTQTQIQEQIKPHISSWFTKFNERTEKIKNVRFQQWSRCNSKEKLVIIDKHH